MTLHELTVRVLNPSLSDDSADSVHSNDGVLVGVRYSLDKRILEKTRTSGSFLTIV